jgi:hypothetical protein
VFYGSDSRLYKWYRTESKECELEQEWGKSSAIKEEGFGLRFIGVVIDSDYEILYKMMLLKAVF